MDIIAVESLSKHYGDKKAVDDVGFTVSKGEVFGFLGPNGAGKTTTIKVLTTLVRPTSGNVRVLGHDLRKEAKQIRNKIGVVQQQESYDQNISVEGGLDLYGFLWDVPKQKRAERVEILLKQFGLYEARKTPSLDLSIGQRRRLQVAREFMHDMDLLFLDEPTVGLDSLARRATLDFLKEKVKNGLTIFFTTHILEEAEYLCNRIAVINNGKIVTTDTPQNLKRKFGQSKSVDFKLLEGTSPELVKLIERIDDVNKIVQDVSDGAYHVTTAKPEVVIPMLYQLAARLNLHITSIYIAEPTLEDAFISILQEDKS
ncbi:MAG: ABC transporter ATP-binding protein [Thaumarchaeota archaeon]|nr:ABC transporter ATP-binding protein [Nitrososphaerota archaeon]